MQGVELLVIVWLVSSLGCNLDHYSSVVILALLCFHILWNLSVFVDTVHLVVDMRAAFSVAGFSVACNLRCVCVCAPYCPEATWLWLAQSNYAFLIL